MSVLSPSITSSSGTSTFTINSFTQNLASVLSDTRRSKSEVAAFFTRHWGEQFVPRQHVAPAPTIPNITLEHFRHYLATTARKHRQYLRARKSLRRGAIRQQKQQQAEVAVSRDEVPDIFFSQNFQNRDKATFESVFLEPKPAESDKILSNAERHRMQQWDQQNPQQLGSRHESTGSLASMLSQQQQPSQPVEANNGRMFRACQRLQQKLELFDDAISALLNQQLETKNEQFWRTIHSYGALHTDLEGTIARVKEIREKLARSKAEMCQRSQRLIQLHYCSLNRQRLFARLHEISCLRDAQTTVQMLLNQEDIPRAIECIHTAQEVLGSELRGVNCFRHLGSQLEEMTRFIGKMLLEEFENIVQREFAWRQNGQQPPQKDEDGDLNDVMRDESQILHTIVFSLIRCREFRFLTILREEITGTVKNTTKQVVKGLLLDSLHDSATLLGFNPSILSEQIVQLTDEQWARTLRIVIQSLANFCDKIIIIQNLIIKLAEQEAANQPKANILPAQRDATRSPSIASDKSNVLPMCPRNEHRRRKSITSAFSEPPNRQNDGQGKMTKSSSRQAKSECAWQEEDEEEEDGGERGDGTEDERQSISGGKGGGRYVATTRPASSQHEPNFTAKSPPPGTPGAILAMPCHDVAQLRVAAPQLVVHAIHACEERVAKLIQARFKDTVLSLCSPAAFNETCQIVAEFVAANLQRIKQENLPTDSPQRHWRSPAQTIIQQTTSKFLAKFTESRRQQLSSTIDAETWKLANITSAMQRLVNKSTEEGKLISDDEENGQPGGDDSESKEILTVNGEPFMVVGSACLLLRLMAQYNQLLRLFPKAAMELVMDVVQCLKLFNSRTCQLILGAGARQMVGLKTITVKHLAIASRSLQLIARFISTIRQEFADRLPADRQQLLRHFDSTARDYADHINEIKAKLLGMMDKELIGALEEWKLEGSVPTPSFQQIVMQIGKFYSSYSAVMPPELTTEMLHAIHANFRLYFKQHCQSRGVSPHDSLTYGMVGEDFSYYVENVRAFPDCKSFPDENIADVLQQPQRKPR